MKNKTIEAKKLEEAIAECTAMLKTILKESKVSGDESPQELSKLAANACSSNAKLEEFIDANEEMIQKKSSSFSGKMKAAWEKAWKAVKMAAKASYEVLEVLRKYWLPLLLVMLFLGCKYEIVRVGIVKVIDLAIWVIMQLLGYSKGYEGDDLKKMLDVTGNVPEGIGRKAIEDIKKYSIIPGGLYDQGSF